MKICTVRPDLPFPHAAQAIQVKRRRTHHKTGKTTIVTIYAITSLPPGRITHAQLATTSPTAKTPPASAPAPHPAS